MDLRVTLKFIKEAEAAEPALHLPATEMAFEIHHPDFSTNNRKETILCLCVPQGRAVPLRFDAPSAIRRVIFEASDLPFSQENGVLSLTLPPLECNHDQAACLHTLIPYEGVELRIEHADPARRAGKYTDGSFPFRQHIAALNLEFALLEAIKALKLDQTAGLGPCGPILLMGFDTNNPAGHTDWPPHMHMHMAAPRFDAPVGHYYFDDNCLIVRNKLCGRKNNSWSSQLGPDEPCYHKTPKGDLLYTLTITPEGGFRLVNQKGQMAVLSSLRSTNGSAKSGFDRGALLTIDGEQTSISTELAFDAGKVAVRINDAETVYRFDPDTGGFLGRDITVLPKAPSATGPARLAPAPQ